MALQRYSADPRLVSDMVSITRGAVTAGGRTSRQHLWGLLYSGDATILSKSPAGLEKRTTEMVAVCNTFDLTVSENKTETLCSQAPYTKSV